MRQESHLIDQKRRRLVAMNKRELVELVAKLWVSVEAMMENTDNPNKPRSGSKASTKLDVKLTKAWTAILRRLSTYKHFRASDVILISRELQRDGVISRTQTPGGARAQLCHLTKKGVIKRRGGGNYQVTEKTTSALDHSLGSKKLGRSRATAPAQ